MLRQSFTAENFRKIFDYENRKGTNLERKYFPEVLKISEKIRDCKASYRSLKKMRSTMTPEKFHEKKNKYYEEKNKLFKEKEEALTNELEIISEKITDKSFSVKLKRIVPTTGKTAYAAEENSEYYFALKQVQFNLKKLYKVKQSNRHEILCQLVNILSNKFPKYIIRTDIYNFYESIPRDTIIKKINEDPLLTHISKKIIKQVLKEYSRLSGSNDGIPRGVGISAYLAELHMRHFDETIREHPEVVYYARYVDDIVIVFCPNIESDITEYKKIIKERLRQDDIGLELNDGEEGRGDKTQEKNLMTPAQKEIEYLGYKIIFGNTIKRPKLELSGKKLERYKKRIDLTFDFYENQKKKNKRKADKILLKRIMFLTSNTRLVGNKRHAFTGIYYSNNHLSSDNNSLNILDGYLTGKVTKLPSSWIKTRLSSLSFKDGFLKRTYIKFSAYDLMQIVRVWKHET